MNFIFCTQKITVITIITNMVAITIIYDILVSGFISRRQCRKGFIGKILALSSYWPVLLFLQMGKLRGKNRQLYFLELLTQASHKFRLR